jgi:hypothetical protein
MAVKLPGVVESAAVTKRSRHAWMLLVLLPIGFGVWVPLVAGLRARRPLWIALPRSRHRGTARARGDRDRRLS